MIELSLIYFKVGEDVHLQKKGFKVMKKLVESHPKWTNQNLKDLENFLIETVACPAPVKKVIIYFPAKINLKGPSCLYQTSCDAIKHQRIPKIHSFCIRRHYSWHKRFRLQISRYCRRYIENHWKYIDSK